VETERVSAGADIINPAATYERAVALARFVQRLDRDDIPSEVWEYAQAVILDTVGCIVGGVTAAPAAPVIEVTRSLAGRSEASVLGTDILTDCVSAAFANSYLADILDFEDTLVSHPSAAAVPAAFAVGERVGASGADVVRAVIAAYEVGVRVQRALMPSFDRRQKAQIEWAWKAFAAATAAGALLQLNDDAWVDAFGFAGAASPVPGLRTLHDRPLTWIKGNFNVQTQVGVLAALLGQAGFQARQLVLEDAGELARMLGSDMWRVDVLTKDLGAIWLLAETELKPYPCCRLIHPSLDAIAELQSVHGFQSDDVVSVVVRSFRSLVDRFADYRPAELIDAEFSVPYTVAVMLLAYPPGPRWHDPRNLADPTIQALADRVRMEEDPEDTKVHVTERRYRATAEITLSDGRLLRARCERPRGGAADPLSIQEVEQKFVRLTEPIIGGHAAWSAHRALRALDEVPDVRALTAKLRVGG
jgi:2-methylcitrate dehydratase PrpD